MDLHDYRFGKGRLAQRLLAMRQRHRDKKVVDDALTDIDQLDAELAKDGSEEVEVEPKEDLLAGLDKIEQQPRFQARNQKAAKGLGIWVLTRPVWQLVAAIVGFVSYVFLRKRK